MRIIYSSIFFLYLLLMGCATGINEKLSSLTSYTPDPQRFLVRNGKIIDQQTQQPVFFKGIGYSPYYPGESPIHASIIADDGRFQEHFKILKSLGANYLHVFPMQLPAVFFQQLDASDIVYGQDVWMFPYAEDFLNEAYQQKTWKTIQQVIDYTYRQGRPDRLVLFSIGDELQPASVARTNAWHPEVRHFSGKYVQVSNRTPTEIALARLIDRAIDYELSTYGQRHLYCHTSFTHIGPLARPDLDIDKADMINPDIGDLVCLNIYRYARGVVTSQPGSSTGSSYQGYLEELAEQSNMPIFITQAGYSTSPFPPKPKNYPEFGGNSHTKTSNGMKKIWQDVQTAKGNEKFCGIAWFELHDEWWKSGETADDPLQQAIEDPEEWFGLYSLGAENRLVPKGKIPATVRSLFTTP